MKQWILASGNAHKSQEFGELFDPAVMAVVKSPKKIEVEETGGTFYENALLKAEGYYRELKLPVLSDDSGVTVQALPDELGIYSARFGGEGLSDRDRAMLLLEKMEGVKDEARTAYFTCVLCFYLSPNEYYFFEGRMDGKIALKYEGEHGFGYDPVFIPHKLDPATTVAMAPEWKKENCHRAVACRQAQKFFSEYSKGVSETVAKA